MESARDAGHRDQIPCWPPGIRFDFFVGRTAAPGKACVRTLEICELGFSMLGKQEPKPESKFEVRTSGIRFLFQSDVTVSPEFVDTRWLVLESRDLHVRMLARWT